MTPWHRTTDLRPKTVVRETMATNENTRAKLAAAGGGHSVDSAAGIEVGQASELYPQENNACRGPPVIKENKACAGPPVLKVMFVVVKVAYILGIPPGFPL